MSELLGKMAESLIAGKIDEVVTLTKEWGTLWELD